MPKQCYHFPKQPQPAYTLAVRRRRRTDRRIRPRPPALRVSPCSSDRSPRSGCPLPASHWRWGRGSAAAPATAQTHSADLSHSTRAPRCNTSGCITGHSSCVSYMLVRLNAMGAQMDREIPVHSWHRRWLSVRSASCLPAACHSGQHTPTTHTTRTWEPTYKHTMPQCTILLRQCISHSKGPVTPSLNQKLTNRFVVG